ncbi:MAG: hypothetical protein IJE60_11465 [Tyzzerella sp.]|nr:hypothetical protein [Tyzzerella sp.]
MVIDNYVKRWCYEEYDLKDEEFFIQRAYWTVNRGWNAGAVKHGIFAAIVSALYACVTTKPLFDALVLLAVMTVSFILHGFRKYDSQKWGTGIFIYFMSLIIILLSRKYIPVAIQWIFAIVGLVGYIYLTFVKPVQFRKVTKELKKKIVEMEEREEAEDRQFYEQWEADYKAFREGLPKFETSNEDPDMIKARQLFEGFEHDKDALKTRYRTLAKKEHPDNGGNEHMFACIVDVYEELRSKLEAK